MYRDKIQFKCENNMYYTTKILDMYTLKILLHIYQILISMTYPS